MHPHTRVDPAKSAVGRTVIVGTDAPPETESSVKVSMDSVDGHWLISGIRPGLGSDATDPTSQRRPAGGCCLARMDPNSYQTLRSAVSLRTGIVGRALTMLRCAPRPSMAASTTSPG